MPGALGVLAVAHVEHRCIGCSMITCPSAVQAIFRFVCMDPPLLAFDSGVNRDSVKN